MILGNTKVHSNYTTEYPEGSITLAYYQDTDWSVDSLVDADTTQGNNDKPWYPQWDMPCSYLLTTRGTSGYCWGMLKICNADLAISDDVINMMEVSDSMSGNAIMFIKYNDEGKVKGIAITSKDTIDSPQYVVGDIDTESFDYLNDFDLIDLGISASAFTPSGSAAITYVFSLWLQNSLGQWKMINIYYRYNASTQKHYWGYNTTQNHEPSLSDAVSGKLISIPGNMRLFTKTASSSSGGGGGSTGSTDRFVTR